MSRSICTLSKVGSLLQEVNKMSSLSLQDLTEAEMLLHELLQLKYPL